MAIGIRWSVVLACPGESELALLAELSARRDVRILAVADPARTSLGAELAEIMGLAVVSDLSGFDPGEVDCLVHGALDEQVADLLDEAAARGISVERAELFADRLAAPMARRTASRTTPPPDLEHLERETAAIHRTLSRIEEALDRESLLRWLLGLAMRAVRAGSGSVMLWDEGAGELYVGFAHGLSEATRHRTRVRAGDGIAGRVAATRQAERVRSRPDDPDRDRSDIIDAVCAPLIWDDRLLGVINLSATEPDGPLRDDALGLVNGLSHRLARILDRFLSLQSVQDQERLQALDNDLAASGTPDGPSHAFLGPWLARFAQAAEAESCSLALLTADGDLCVTEPGGMDYVSPPDGDRAAVLASGIPRVLRRGGDEGETIYHLPLGREPHRAVLTVGFVVPGPAHRFGALSEAHIYLANRHLVHALALATREDEIERLTLLSSALSSLAEMQDKSEATERVLAAACRLTGAQRALLVDDREPSPGDTDGDLKAEAARLLRRAGDQGWISTTLQTGPDGARSVLAVPLDTTRPLPGLLLVGKDRVHPLDATLFTATDARFARRLLPLLRTPRVPAAAAAAAASNEGGTTQLLSLLRREMDRCDRYHTMLGIAAFRLSGRPESGLVTELVGRLRSSDQVGCLDDGTVIIVVPEEIQSLHRLQNRVEGLLAGLSGVAARVMSGSAVYPGPAGDPVQLLGAATKGWA